MNIRHEIYLDRELAALKTSVDGLKHKHGLDDDRIRQIRRVQKLDKRTDGEGFYCVSANIDREVYKKFYPNRWFDKEEQEIFTEEHWIHPRYSAYDCTGCRFTEFIDFYAMPHGTWVYQIFGYDI